MERKKLFWPVVKALFWSAVVVFANRKEVKKMSKVFLSIGLVLVALSMVGFSAAIAQDDPEDSPIGERITLWGTLQKTADGVYTLNGKYTLQSQLDLEPYVGKEVAIRGEVIAEDPTTVEVLAIEEYQKPDEPSGPYTPSAGDHIDVRGILQKTADGTYVADEVVLQSSSVDLESYVGQLVCAKGEVVAEEPLTIEVEAIEGYENEPPRVPHRPPMACLHGLLQKTGDGEYTLENAEGRPSPVSGVVLQSSTIELEEWVGMQVCLQGEIVSEDPLTIEVLAVKEYEETNEPGIGEVPPQTIGAHGTLLKTDDGTYTLDDRIIVQSRTIDLEEWVDMEVVIKAEVVARDPEPILEVLAICEYNSVASEAVTDGEESYDAETLRKMISGATAVEPSSWGKVKAGFR